MAVRPSRPFAGWWVVGAVFVLLMGNAGLGFYGLAVYLEAITSEQGLSTAAVSAGTSIYFIVSGLAGRLIAPVIERRDIRVVVAIGGAIAALGLFLVTRSTTLFALYGSYTIFAVGNGLSGLVPATTLVTRWFHTGRSVALSVASTGLSVGGLTVTVLAAWLIDSRLMRGAGPWLVLIQLVLVFVPLLALWPDPARRGLRPDGATEDVAADQGATGIGYEQAVASRFFRAVTVAFVFTMASQVGAIAQLVKLGAERVDDATGTLAISVLAFTSVVARLVGGVVAPRVGLLRLTTVLAFVQGMSLLWLAVADTRWVLLAAVVTFGITIGNLLMLQPLLIADRFGVANYPRIYSLSSLIVVGLGVAGGPYLLGLLHDLASYRLSYVVAGLLSVVGTLVFTIADPVAVRTGSSPTPMAVAGG